MSFIKNIFISCDFLGPNIGFEYKNGKNYQSYQGSFYSLIIISVTTVIGFLFGQEIYLRNQPMVSFSTEVLTQSRVDLKYFPMIFSFTDSYGDYISTDQLAQILNWDLVSFTTIPDYNRSVNEVIFNECSNTTVPEFLREAFIRDIGSYDNVLCFDSSSYFFQNYYSTYNSTFLNFRIRVCDPNVTSCYPNPEEYINDIYVNFIFFDSYVNANNYTHPVQYLLKNFNIQLSDQMLKRNFIRVNHNILNADDGWLLNSVVQSDYVSFYNNEITYDLVNIDSEYPLDRLWITFESPLIKNTIYRSYLKVQDLLAKIGGIAKFLLIVIQLSSQHHLKFLYLNFIKTIANEEIISQVNVNKLPDKDQLNLKDVNLNSSNIELNEVKPSTLKEENKFGIKNDDVNLKIQKIKDNNIRPINERSMINEPIKMNNFVISQAMKNFNECHSDNFSYFDLLKANICCDNNKKTSYDKSLDAIKQLVDIKLFSRLMMNFHYGVKE